jgi:hypothetical protein
LLCRRDLVTALGSVRVNCQRHSVKLRIERANRGNSPEMLLCLQQRQLSLPRKQNEKTRIQIAQLSMHRRSQA